MLVMWNWVRWHSMELQDAIGWGYASDSLDRMPREDHREELLGQSSEVVLSLLRAGRKELRRVVLVYEQFRIQYHSHREFDGNCTDLYLRFA